MKSLAKWITWDYPGRLKRPLAVLSQKTANVYALEHANTQTQTRTAIFLLCAQRCGASAVQVGIVVVSVRDSGMAILAPPIFVHG